MEVQDLQVSFGQEPKLTIAVDGASFSVHKGQTLAIVGESGSGKSVTSLSILNLLQENQESSNSGKITFTQGDKKLPLLELEKKKIQKIRGHRISMVFQEPMSSFNPVIKCGKQAKEILDIHGIGLKSERKQMVLDQFHKVALTDIDRIYNSYPHELSGGQLQRISIAMALISQPDLIICDEPTTALDVSVQKEIIDLLRLLVKEEKLTLIFVSHDLDVVASLCDSVIVMNRGRIVESGSLPRTFIHPQTRYTQALMACKPNINERSHVLPTIEKVLEDSFELTVRPVHRTGTSSILRVENLTMNFGKNKSGIFSKRETLTAVDRVTFEVYEGAALGIVGESGSGKSTIANCIAGILRPTKGKIWYKDKPINSFNYKKDKSLRRAIQMIFQDPYGSLNPAMTVGNSVTEPIWHHRLVTSKTEAKKRTIELFEKVGLEPSFYDRYPRQLSGGQRQRVSIARSLGVEPKILICDECVSALDVSIQAQILNLLDHLRSEFQLTLLFISHDLSVVHYLCDEILVMQNGRIVERGTSESIINNPQEAYTKTLIESIPNCNL